MNFVPSSEKAKEWGISQRRVAILCKEGRVPGAELVGNRSTTAPLNVQVRLRAYCMIWELKQKYYKADTPLPYVSKASHKADEDKIKSLEARIIKGGSDEERAVKAVAEAKEYLEIVAGSRVKNTRVY